VSQGRFLLVPAAVAILLLSCHPHRYAHNSVLESRDVGCISYWTQGQRLDSLATTIQFPEFLDSLPRFNIRKTNDDSIPVPPLGIYVHPQLADTFALLFLQREDSLLVGSILQRCHLESPIFIPNDSIAHIVAPGDYILLAAHDGIVVARSRYVLISNDL
jgi:hypothetical protein